MSTADSISIGVSVGLGLLSVGLSGFAIWLSFQFDKRSKEALDKVKELTREIKTSVDVGLSQQQDMSTKMLDSIIDQNKYGETEAENLIEKKSRIEEIINERFDQTESKIVEQVKATIHDLGGDKQEDPERLNRALQSLRDDLAEFRETASDARTGFVTPQPLRNMLTKYRTTPAHYTVIAAIVNASAQSTMELEKVRYEYCFPGSWDSGLKNLIQDGLLVGSRDDFEVRDELQKPLQEWLDLNWPVIHKLIRHYNKTVDLEGEGDSKGVGDEELEIANELTF